MEMQNPDDNIAKPRPDAKTKILVCDDGKSDWYGMPVIQRVIRVLEESSNSDRWPRSRLLLTYDKSLTFEAGKYEVTWVKNLDQAVDEVRSHVPPYYALVIYAAQHIHDGGGAKHIAKVTVYDSFMPQMTVGDKISRKNVKKADRAGCDYDAETLEELANELKKIFRGPKDIPNCVVVKRGGSMDDFDREMKNKYNFEIFCEILRTLYSPASPYRKELKKHKRKNRITDNTPGLILTTGAGQIGLVIGDHVRKYTNQTSVAESLSEEVFKKILEYGAFGIKKLINLLPTFSENVFYRYQHSKLAELKDNLDEYLREAKARALEENARMMYAHLGKAHSTLIARGKFYYVDKETINERIPIMSIAPHWILARDRIPLEDSDTHTIALAEFYGAKRVVLVKRTDGIYDFDPYRGFVADPITGECKSLKEWSEAQKGNRRHGIITVDGLLNHILREGTDMEGNGKADGTTGHLMEDSALYYFSHCKKVEEILVTHIAPEEMYCPIGRNRFKHIITGEELELGPGGWEEVLKERLIDAFHGDTLSKIVR